MCVCQAICTSGMYVGPYVCDVAGHHVRAVTVGRRVLVGPGWVGRGRVQSGDAPSAGGATLFAQALIANLL